MKPETSASPVTLRACPCVCVQTNKQNCLRCLRYLPTHSAPHHQPQPQPTLPHGVVSPPPLGRPTDQPPSQPPWVKPWVKPQQVPGSIPPLLYNRHLWEDCNEVVNFSLRTLVHESRRENMHKYMYMSSCKYGARELPLGKVPHYFLGKHTVTHAHTEPVAPHSMKASEVCMVSSGLVPRACKHRSIICLYACHRYSVSQHIDKVQAVCAY